MRAEVLIVPPARDADGIVASFVKRCVVWGVDFHFEPGDRLPGSLPVGVEGVRAVFIDETRVQENRAVLEAYRAQDAATYVMSLHVDPATPNATLGWSSPLVQHMATVDAGLTVPSDAMRDRMLARDEEALFGGLARRLRECRAERWYDATAYNWEAMLDLGEVTGDGGWLDLALSQMRRMMREVPNDLDNCDCIAPLLPMLRASEHVEDPSLIRFAREHIDRYLERTPRCRGCLVNFNVYPHHVRSEILWQVLPALMKLGRVTGEGGYLRAAWEEYARLHALLHDPVSRLWHHGVGPAGNTREFWSRGAAFSTFGTLRVLEMTPPTETMHAHLLKTFREACGALPRFQREDGFFHAVLDAPTTQAESSGTAWIAALLMRGLRLGYLDEALRPAADRAYQAMRTRVWDGDFPGHMTATTASHVPGYYHKIGLSESGWAHFALRAMCERRRAGGWSGGV